MADSDDVTLPDSFKRGGDKPMRLSPDGSGFTAAATVKRQAVKKPSIKRAKTIEVKRDSRLAEVPTRTVYDEYVGRAFDGMTYTRVFDYCRVSHSNLLIQGPTGSGKTHAVMAYAALRELPYYSISSSVGVESSQLFGKYIPNEHGEGFVWQDGPVTDLARYGGVLLINEINFIPERVSTVLFSLLDRRREIQLVDHHGEVIRAHDELLIVADMNPHYEGTRPLNRALRNRFSIQLDWDYDPAVERELIKNPALVEVADRIRKDDSTSMLMVPVSTNMLLEFDQIVRKTRNVTFAVTNFLAHWESADRQFVDIIIRAMIANITIEYEKGGVL